MVRVAIAGASGGLGRTLLDELSQGEDHVIFALSRKNHHLKCTPLNDFLKSELPFETSSNVHCLAAPYDDVDALQKLLDSNAIHTVLSTLNPPFAEVTTREQNLIRAAAQSVTVKRFIPSQWGVDWGADDEHLPLSWKIFKQQIVTELEQHRAALEYTIVDNGYFLDYFGMPHCQSYMLPEAPYVDIAACKAAIPGSGDDKVTFTSTKDVAKFVRKMVESDAEWSTRTRIVGDYVTFNEIVKVAEDVRGTRFDVVRDSLENLRAGKITEIPAWIPMYEILPKAFMLEMFAGLGVSMIMGLFQFEGELLNDKYPDIRPAKMHDFIKTHWEGKP